MLELDRRASAMKTKFFVSLSKLIFAIIIGWMAKNEMTSDPSIIPNYVGLLMAGILSVVMFPPPKMK